MRLQSYDRRVKAEMNEREHGRGREKATSLIFRFPGITTAIYVAVCLEISSERRYSELLAAPTAELHNSSPLAALRNKTELC